MLGRKPLPPLVRVETIRPALSAIFPAGVEHRAYLVREIAAKTIFTMIYAGAIEGLERWVRPDQVTKMTDLQSALDDDASRRKWSIDSIAPGKMNQVAGRWYAPNTRESIRDETLRSGLVRCGAVIERRNIPTTSSRPRYALARSFYELLRAHSLRAGFAMKKLQWQKRHLGAASLARATLLRGGALLANSTDRVRVKLPGRGLRHLLPGPSAFITKAVIEKFAALFLRRPAVILLSQSGEKLEPSDRELAAQLGINLRTDRDLPDVILFDGLEGREKLVFVEVVATDGAITSQRKEALARFVAAARFDLASVRYVTAFSDRGSPAFKKAAPEIAWDTFAWFVSEPRNLLLFKRDAGLNLEPLVTPRRFAGGLGRPA